MRTSQTERGCHGASQADLKLIAVWEDARKIYAMPPNRAFWNDGTHATLSGYIEMVGRAGTANPTKGELMDPLDRRHGITQITLPGPNNARARRVVTRSRFRSTGKYPSWKMGRMLQWEFVHECNAFRLLDADPFVTYFCEQPCIVEYVLDGVMGRHFPDILVQSNDTKELWDIKTSKESSEKEFALRTSLLTQRLPQFGYTYRVVFSEELETQPRLGNAVKLLRFGYRTISEMERESMRLEMQRCGFLFWSDACTGKYGKKAIGILCRLVLEGTLVIDMTLPIAPSTRFTVGSGGF